jgi:hypothetical protein
MRAMKKTLSFVQFLTWSCAVCLPLSAAHAVEANFNGANGTTQPDDYVGTAGDGWVAGWTSSGAATGTGIVATTPLNSGGNYLQVVDNTTSTTVSVRRQFQSTPGLDITQPYRITLDFRADGDATTFNVFGDRFGIFGDSATSASSTAASNTWGIGVVGGTSGAGSGQSAFPMRWYFFDRNVSSDFNTSNMFDTSLGFVFGRTYSITIDVNPGAGTYGASINDGVNPVVSATDLGFRKGVTASVSDTVGIVANADAPTDNSRFSVDSIRITAVPEPATATLLGLAGLVVLQRRRRS